jgi:nitroimidazol reductase NimA-like FMN-containing flavoprotein (pyridoxamine 5'-phosphate oxidase superfamily)
LLLTLYAVVRTTQGEGQRQLIPTPEWRTGGAEFLPAVIEFVPTIGRMPADYEPTERTQVRRKRGRGSYDRTLVHAILDEALICHLGFVDDGHPYVTPTIHARDGETIYLHGSPANRTFEVLAAGAPCCLTATRVDELVLARTARNHSLNYRSVMVLGTAREITDSDEKQRALRAVVEHIAPGRPDEIGGPSEKDLETTRVLSMTIEEASAKVRTGPPMDKPEALALPYWAGQVPLTIGTGDPVPAPDLAGDVPVPEHLTRWQRP